jgi:hypothetical protein
MQALAQATWFLNSSIIELSQRIGGIGGMAANPPQRRAAGGVIYASNGQLVNMEPRGTDTVPAMLTPGEFVVNARSTKKHRRLLEQINGNSNASLRDGVTYAAGGAMIGGPMFGMPNMTLAEERYMAYLRWYQENYGMGAQKLIPISARNMIRRQVQQDLMMEGQQQQQRAAYSQWLQSKEGADFQARKAALVERYPEGPEGALQRRRVQNLSPSQVIIEEKRIQKEKERAEIKQKVVEKRRKEKEAAQEERLREAAGGDEQRYQELRRYVEGEPQQRPQPTQPTTKTEEDWTPFSGSRGTVRQYNPRTGQIEIIDPQTGQIIERVGPTKRKNKFLDRASPASSPGSGNGKFNTVALEERAARLAGASESVIQTQQQNMDDTYGGGYGIGGGMLWLADLGSRGISAAGSYMFGTQQYRGGTAIYQDQIDREKAKLKRIEQARGYIKLANDPNLSHKERYKYYQIAHRILYGSHLNAPTFAGGATEAEYAAQQENIGSNELAAASALNVIDGGMSGGLSRGMSMLGRGASAVRRAGSRLLGRGGAKTATTTGRTAAKTGTTAAREASETAAERAATTGPKTGEQVAEKGLLPYETPTTGRIEIGVQGPNYSSVRVSPGPGTNTGTASSNANTSLRYRPIPSPSQATDAATRRRLGYSNGGIVQPAYLSGGGGAWQFEDLASGYFDYNALNTDPLAYRYDNPFSKYASPREKSYDRIAQGFSGLGMGDFASSRGLGLDAAGRLNFESQYGYSDPRSDERDFQTIFGYNRYPSFLASGGLAKGTDKYPAMLSRGEMVMNAEATRRNEGILRAMNKSSGGIVNNGILYAANGTDGPIGMSGGASSGGLGAVLGGAAELSQSINSFMSVSDFVAGSFNNLSNSLSLFTQMDFGVLNEGATMMQTASSIFRTAASSLNTPLSGFGQSVQSFVSQTSNLISAIARIGDVNGTINVTGRIDIPPIQVNVVGAEIVQRIVPDIESRIMNSIATSLANDYPGLTLSVGSPNY